MSAEIPETSDFGRDVMIAGYRQFDQFIGFLNACQMIKKSIPVDEQDNVIAKICEIEAMKYFFN